MRELNLDHLRTLLAVMDLGSFANAGAALNLAQPTVSLHLRELESRLDVRLLERGRRGVAATPAGMILIDYARKLLDLADHATESIQNHKEGRLGEVNVGASAGLIAHHMPKLLHRIAATRPDVKINLAVTTTAMAVAKLQSGELDLALVGAAVRQSGLACIGWRSDSIMAYLPATWSAPKRVTPAWLHQHPLLMNEPGSALRHQTVRWFGQAGFFPQPKIALDNGEALKSLVAAGYGAALLPVESTLERSAQMQVVPISPAMARRTYLAHKKTKHLAQPLQAVIDLLLADKYA